MFECNVNTGCGSLREYRVFNCWFNTYLINLTKYSLGTANEVNNDPVHHVPGLMFSPRVLNDSLLSLFSSENSPEL